MACVYLGHPIDFAREEKRSQYAITANALTAELLMRSVSCVYQPMRAWTAQQPMSKKIQEVNTHALLNSDIAVFIWETECGSFGVPFEIGLAHANSIPVVLMTNWGAQARERSAVINWSGVALCGIDEVDRCARLVETTIKGQSVPVFGATR